MRTHPAHPPPPGYGPVESMNFNTMVGGSRHLAADDFRSSGDNDQGRPSGGIGYKRPAVPPPPPGGLLLTLLHC